MAIRKSVGIKWVPGGVTDSVDGSTSLTGSMANLSNLVPDDSTDHVFVPRPASTRITNFASGFTTPAGLTGLFIVGTLAYGMISSATFAGHDEPFCYDLVNNVFIAITGTTLANTPTTQSTSGDWVPPTLDIIGTKIIVTHPGFDGVTYFFGTLNVANPAAPTWTAGNTVTNALPSRPNAVANFSGRAYYACGNTAYYSDVLVPGTMTNAGQAVTCGDSTNIVAFKGTPFAAALTGGIVQGLIVFKNTAIFQILGDADSSILSNNVLTASLGLYAPLAIAQAPQGLLFVSSHGMRLIDQSAVVSEVIGDHGQGVAVPFINVQTPTRMVMAYNSDVIRISCTTLDNFGNTVNQEWWYDFTRKVWTGPHTFPSYLIYAYLDDFIIAPIGTTHSLWKSNVHPSTASTYIENSVQLSFIYQTSLLPDNDNLSNNQVVESSVAVESPQSSTTYNFLASDEQGNTLSQVTQVLSSNTPIWGVVVWGAFSWGATSRIQQRPIYWDKPLVFRQMQIQVSGNSTLGLRIGTLHMRYQPLNYQQKI